MKPSTKKLDKKREVAGNIAGYLIENGLSDSGIRSLAKAANISDRMLIYYFESKEAAIAEALELIAATLAEQLEAVIPAQSLSAPDLLEQLTQAGKSAAFRPVIRLWFELVGLAVRGEQPYRDSVRMMANNWQLWISLKLRKGSRHQAEDIFAQLEGRLMLDQLLS